MKGIVVLSVAAATIALFGFAGGAVAQTMVGGTLAGDQVYGQWEDPIFVGTLLDGATGACLFRNRRHIELGLL